MTHLYLIRHGEAMSAIKGFVGDGGLSPWHLIKYNDAFHLHDIGTPAHIPWGQISVSPVSDRDRLAVPIEAEPFDVREQADDAT